MRWLAFYNASNALAARPSFSLAVANYHSAAAFFALADSQSQSSLVTSSNLTRPQSPAKPAFLTPGAVTLTSLRMQPQASRRVINFHLPLSRFGKVALGCKKVGLFNGQDLSLALAASHEARAARGKLLFSTGRPVVVVVFKPRFLLSGAEVRESTPYKLDSGLNVVARHSRRPSFSPSHFTGPTPQRPVRSTIDKSADPVNFTGKGDVFSGHPTFFKAQLFTWY